jgi:threonyl-tRNA synthetase
VREKAAAGYQRVVTPHIAKRRVVRLLAIYHTKRRMYPPMVMDDGTYYMKAMNCPHHHEFITQGRSYRELLRLAESGTCYKAIVGTLAGLLRVRALAMNDAHMYVRKEQIKTEFANVIRLTQEYFDIFGLEKYWFRLSKWDPSHTDKYINQPENWGTHNRS